VSAESLGLVRYDAMRHAIAEAHAIDEVKDIRDRALALETYARQAMNDEDERRCREIRQRAERKAGQLLNETKRAQGSAQPGVGRRGASAMPSGEPRTLADDGISYDQSSNWQKVAVLSDYEFEAALAQGASTSNLVEMAKFSEQKKAKAEAPSEDFEAQPDRQEDERTIEAKRRKVVAAANVSSVVNMLHPRGADPGDWARRMFGEATPEFWPPSAHGALDGPTLRACRDVLDALIRQVEETNGRT
jgi:hypothetical protein